MKGASSATSTKTATMTMPMMPRRFMEMVNREQLRPRLRYPFRIYDLRNPDSRIQPAIQQISQRVREDVSRADRQHTSLHDAVIAFGDSVFNQKQPETGPAENFLGDDCAREQHA